MHRPKISVVVLNWNGLHMIDECLDSLTVQSYKNFEIIVVDNGSIDGSVDHITKKYPHVRLLPQSKNLGFSGGVNVGIKNATGDYIALLNNDAFVKSDWVDRLVKVFDRNPSIAICTSKILKQNKHGDKYKIDSTGDYYSIWGLPFPRGRGEWDEGQYDAKTNVFAASGGASIYRAKLFKEIGLFDEEFFAYYEDVDISFRARLAGHKIHYEPKAIVYHKIGATSGGGRSAFSRYHSIKNTWYCYLKNLPAKFFWKYLPRLIFIQMLQLISSIRNGLLWPHIKSTIRAIIMTPTMIIKRYKIQKSRKIGASDLDRWLIKTMPPLQQASMKKYFGRFYNKSGEV